MSEPTKPIAIAVARFYEELADRLIAGAQRVLDSTGFGEAPCFDVPGAFELPSAAKYLAQSGDYAGVICLGAVIRGETSHYDYVCGEAARGIQDVSLSTGVPCGFGVLTCDTYDQAIQRSGEREHDMGGAAARAVLSLLAIKSSVQR